jgi:hypothetical protein
MICLVNSCSGQHFCKPMPFKLNTEALSRQRTLNTATGGNDIENLIKNQRGIRGME